MSINTYTSPSYVHTSTLYNLSLYKSNGLTKLEFNSGDIFFVNKDDIKAITITTEIK